MDKHSLTATIAGILSRYHVSSMYLFGSVAEGRDSATSDVDIAVEGLPGPDYFDAMVALSDALGRDVDLVRLEKASPRMREHILRIGEPIAA